MGKPTICICENKGADQLRGHLATKIVHFLFFLNPKFQAYSLLLCLYSLTRVGSGRNYPEDRFSRVAAEMIKPFRDTEQP